MIVGRHAGVFMLACAVTGCYRPNAEEQACVDLARERNERLGIKATPANRSVQVFYSRRMDMCVQTSEARVEKLNAFDQFKTNIDGVDIHFVHQRSKFPNAMPLCSRIH